MKLVALVLTLPLGFCQTIEAPAPASAPDINIQESKLPVAVSCVPDNFDRTPPMYPDTPEALANAKNVRDLAALNKAANILLHSRNEQLEAVVKKCDRPKPAS